MDRGGLVSAEATPWERGRFDGRKGASELLFGRMYEDSAIELAAFAGKRRVFCIGSAGCTAFALAAAGHTVCAVDVNARQVEYLRARAAGGAYRSGKAERIVALGRGLLWRRRTLAAFLDLEDTGAQMAYWRRHLDTARFRGCLRVLLSATALRLRYSRTMTAPVGRRLDLAIRARLERGWARFPNRGNPYARALFLGEPPVTPAFDPARLEVRRAEAAAFLESSERGRFDGLTLSNIVDATSEKFQKRLFAAVRGAAAPGAVVVVRSFREGLLENEGGRAGDDRSLLWGSVRAIPVERL